MLFGSGRVETCEGKSHIQLGTILTCTYMYMYININMYMYIVCIHTCIQCTCTLYTLKNTTYGTVWYTMYMYSCTCISCNEPWSGLVSAHQSQWCCTSHWSVVVLEPEYKGQQGQCQCSCHPLYWQWEVRYLHWPYSTPATPAQDTVQVSRVEKIALYMYIHTTLHATCAIYNVHVL